METRRKEPTCGGSGSFIVSRCELQRIVSNGLGAGFAGLTLLAVLLGLATLLALVLAGVVLIRRRSGAIPRLLTYVSGGLGLGVLLVAGFGVLALYDEAPPLAALFVAVVVLPLAAVGIFLRRTTELTPLDSLATAGWAWSLPFVVGVVITVGLPVAVRSGFDLAPVESQRLGLVWIATTVGGLVVVVGSLVLGKLTGTLLQDGERGMNP